MKKKNFFILLLLSGVVVVVGLCILMTIMAHRRQKHTALYRQGEAAYKQGNYELARKKLSEYLWRRFMKQNVCGLMHRMPGVILSA